MRGWNGLAGLAVLLVVTGCGGSPERANAGERQPEAREAAEAEGSDLDRPLDELAAARCEHGIPMYTCDECRYEVGFVKVAPDLVGPGKGIELATLARQPLMDAREATGEVVLNDGRAVWLSPRAPGVVRGIRVDIGEKVMAGQILYEVDSMELSEARATFVTARAELELAQATFARESDLFGRKICPEKDMLEAKASLQRAGAAERAARERLLRFGLANSELQSLPQEPPGPDSGLLAVRAPFAGTVLERALGLGALVNPGDRTLLVADTSRMWIQTALYEREVAAVLELQTRQDVRAEVTVPSYPGRSFPGVVERVAGTLDESTRTARARVVVDNPGNLLRAGMLARVRLLMPAVGDALAAPADAVLDDEGRQFVFVRWHEPYFVRRPVRTGRAWPGWVEISEGLSAGQEVVAHGAFLLKSDVLRSKMGAGCAD
jgi:membrane fusion protein, heavy metal efflux system